MTLYPETSELRTLFDEEVNRLGGTVIDRVETSRHYFLRALLPRGGRVQPRDFIGHGLALRTRGTQVVVHPYTFRQLCSNGAIHITNVSSRAIQRTEQRWESQRVVEEVREAIQASSEPGAFEANLSEMQQMLSQEVRMPLVMAAFLSRLGNRDLVMRILDRYLDHGDRSLFGLMNAVTAEAREEPNPERRWQLEELGGGILAALKPPAPVLEPGRARAVPKRKRQDSLV